MQGSGLFACYFGSLDIQGVRVAGKDTLLSAVELPLGFRLVRHNLLGALVEVFHNGVSIRVSESDGVLANGFVPELGDGWNLGMAKEPKVFVKAVVGKTALRIPGAGFFEEIGFSEVHNYLDFSLIWLSNPVVGINLSASQALAQIG